MQKMLAKILSITMIICSLIGCYHVQLQQGNILTPTAIAQIQVGLTKQQVIDLLGRSLLATDYQSNCWDYFYTIQDHHQQLIVKNLHLVFQQERLKTVNYYVKKI